MTLTSFFTASTSPDEAEPQKTTDLTFPLIFGIALLRVAIFEASMKMSWVSEWLTVYCSQDSEYQWKKVHKICFGQAVGHVCIVFAIAITTRVINF